MVKEAWEVVMTRGEWREDDQMMEGKMMVEELEGGAEGEGEGDITAREEIHMELWNKKWSM